MGIVRKVVNRTILFGTLGATGYGYYMGYKYPSLPFYKVPEGMKMNAIVSSLKEDREQYFPYCDTFHKTVKLSPDVVGKYPNEQDLINHVARKFQEGALVKSAKTPGPENEETQNGRSIFTIFDPRKVIRKPKVGRSVVSEVLVPKWLVKSVETLSDYKFPYRINNSTVREIYVELKPVVNSDSIVETYDADVYYSVADLYSHHDHDGKLLPHLVTNCLRLYNRVIFEFGTNAINSE